jgi:hypothetical protein
LRLIGSTVEELLSLYFGLREVLRQVEEVLGQVIEGCPKQIPASFQFNLLVF